MGLSLQRLKGFLLILGEDDVYISDEYNNEDVMIYKNTDENFALGLNEARDWCKDKNLDIFFPKTTEDLDWMEEIMEKNSMDSLWIPIYLKDTDCTFAWLHGKGWLYIL